MSSMALTVAIAKFKEAANGQIDVWAESPRLLKVGYLHHRLPVMGCDHYCDNAITYKAQRDKKCQRIEAGERGNYWHADVSDVAVWCNEATKELADVEVENDALRDDAAGRRRLGLSKQSVSQCVKPPPPPAIMQASPTGRHRRTGLFHPQREADHYAKTTGSEPRSILMSSADRVAHIDGQLMQLLWAIHTRFQRSINA